MQTLMHFLPLVTVLLQKISDIKVFFNNIKLNISLSFQKNLNFFVQENILKVNG